MKVCAKHFKCSVIPQDQRNVLSVSNVIGETVSNILKQKIEAFKANWKIIELDGVGFNEKLKTVGVAESKGLPSLRYQIDGHNAEESQSLEKMFVSTDAFSELTSLPKDPFFELNSSRLSDWNEAPRFPIFRVFYDPCNSTGNLNQFFREKRSILSENFGFRFLVQLKDLKLSLDIVEPFFVTVFLLDSKNKIRCSENYHHMFVPDDFSESNPGTIDIPVFSLPSTSKHIHLIVEVRKTLSSDKEFEFYFKPENVKEKHLDLLRNNAARLKDFQQCFAWGALPLFGDSGELILGKDEKVNPLFKLTAELSDEKIGDLIPEILSGNYSKRLKILSGYISLSVEPFQFSQPQRILTSSRNPVKLDENENGETASRYCEIQSFLPTLEPLLSYQNFLYVYPEFVNLSNRGGSLSVRNIVCSVMLKQNDSIDQSAVKVLYSPFEQNELKCAMFSSVTYHSKSPSFLEEFKIQLPVNLSISDHLLFIFYHVTCKVTNKNECATPIGYSWMPIFRHNRLISNEVHETPVAVELFNGYIENKEMKFIDNKKPLFRFRTQCLSSVYSQDSQIAYYFNALERHLQDDSLASAVKGLEEANVLEVIQQMPFILNSLISLVCSSISCRRQAFSTFLLLCKSISQERHDSGRCALLDSYVHCFEVPDVGNPSGILIDELLFFIEHMQDSLSDGGFSHIWIIFDLVVKCVSTQNDGVSEIVFVEKLTKLFSLCANFIFSKKNEGLNLVKSLNRNLSFFLGDLIEIINDESIFSLISTYFALLKKAEDTVTHDLILDACSILSQTPHLLQLSRTISFSFETTDCSKFMKVNSGVLFFGFLLLEQIIAAFKHSEKSVRQRGVILLRDFFYTKEISENDSVQREIADIYFPFVFVILDHLTDVQCWSLFDKRNVFVCFFWILKNVSHEFLKKWLLAETPHRIMRLFSALACGYEAFKYLGKSEIAKMTASSTKDVTVNNKSILEKMYDGGGGSLTRTSRTSRTFTLRGKNTLRDDNLRYKRRTLRGQTEIYQENYDWKLEAALCLEIGLIVLNFLFVYEETFCEELSNNHHGWFEEVFNLLITIGKHHQSDVFIVTLTHFFRILVSKYPDIIFAVGTTYLVKLCPLLMGFCNHKSEKTRSSSSGLLYVLMQMNFKLYGNFTRMKVQTTVALSQLVGEVIENDMYIKESLNCLLQYASAFEKEEIQGNTSHSFHKQLNKLIDGLFGILKDSSSIKRCSLDPEMTADLFFNIAQGYKQAPDIRVAWLRNLVNFHSERGNWAEAGECVLHIAASVAEYLERHEPKPGMPKGASAFRHISPNIVDESVIAELLVDDEETCQSEPFSQNGLISLLNEGITLFKKGQLFEVIHEIYKLLIPVLEAERRYEQLCEVFNDLHLVFKEIVTCTKTDSRILGTYYRVAFFGKPFLELSGKQFIYKEPFCTQLVDIVPRLQSLYEGILAQSVQIIQGSKPVSADLIHAAVPSIQITSVTPFFDEWEFKERVSYFERNHNVKQFVFETPFTLTGKVHGNIDEQWIKQTILQVSTVFPYVKKRIEVSGTLEKDISPIENGIKNVEEQTAKLKAELKKEPVDLKQLQMNLQGSVRVQVNAGPLEICRVFLSPNNSVDKSFIKNTKRLKNAVRQFLKTCREALEVNGKFIGPEQTEFHETLQQGYKELDDEICKLIES
eukprot:GCRY01001972.1.p1 GENE.GCRY01001972.1~~GCRY01001972.1.p1  ORF type:complete len:1667 (+),score=122.71 GCRY01001972.1:145-5145(+)